MDLVFSDGEDGALGVGIVGEVNGMIAFSGRKDHQHMEVDDMQFCRVMIYGTSENVIDFDDVKMRGRKGGVGKTDSLDFLHRSPFARIYSKMRISVFGGDG